MKKMGSQPTPEQWGQLYSAAQSVKALEPWKKVGSEDIILIAPPEAEPLFCSIISSEGVGQGISVYNGYDSYFRFLRLINGNAPMAMEGKNQRCIN